LPPRCQISRQASIVRFFHSSPLPLPSPDSRLLTSDFRSPTLYSQLPTLGFGPVERSAEAPGEGWLRLGGARLPLRMNVVSGGKTADSTRSTWHHFGAIGGLWGRRWSSVRVEGDHPLDDTR
jgi:hypothetical protein